MQICLEKVVVLLVIIIIVYLEGKNMYVVRFNTALCVLHISVAFNVGTLMSL